MLILSPGDLLERRRAMMARPLATPPPATVSAWLRQSATSGAVASWDNVLNAANPAVQATSARQPTAGSDFALTFDGGDDLAWQIDSTNYSRDTFEVCFWYKPASVAGIQTLFAIRSIGNPDGASANAFDIRANGTGLQFDVWSDGTNGRRLSLSSVLTASTAVMITAGFNGSLGTEAARQIISINGVVSASGTFSSLNSPPATLTQLAAATGNINIGSRSGISLPIAVGGKLARNLYTTTAASVGATAGCWLTAERTAMFGFEPLT